MTDVKELCRYVIHFEDSSEKEMLRKHWRIYHPMDPPPPGTHFTYDGNRYVIRDVTLKLEDIRNEETLVEMVQLHIYCKLDPLKKE